MKVYCGNCGCHFPQEFKETLEPPCNFWGDRGMGNLPKDYKEKIWNWQFSLPIDELSVKFKVQFYFQFGGTPVNEQDTFAAQVPGWNEMSELDRQQYEKKHFKEEFRKQRDKPAEDKAQVVINQPPKKEKTVN